MSDSEQTDKSYELIETPPLNADFRRLRKDTGLSEKTEEAAAIALPNTWFGVHIVCQNEVVGMGRIIGDGGCHFQVVDVAVLPNHQGKGLGKRIMSALVHHFEVHAPASAYISLIADGPAKDLYAQYGFRPVTPESIGMSRWVHANETAK